jgi:anti-sigma factor RsiW
MSVLKISASFGTNDLSYSLSIQSENQHIFSVYGFIKELNSGATTITYTTKNGHDLQFSISI